MVTVQIRKQGGAAIITIPAHILKELHLQVGAKLLLNVTAHGFSVKPAAAYKRVRKRYTLKELLKGVTRKEMKAAMKKLEWLDDMKPVGKEII